MIHVYQRLIRVEILLVLNKFKTNALLIVSIYFKSYKYIYIIYIIYIYIYAQNIKYISKYQKINSGIQIIHSRQNEFRERQL